MIKRQKRIVINPKYILIAFIILCCALMIASARYSNNFSSAKETVGNIFSPMQTGLNSIGRTAVKCVHFFKLKSALIDENENLKSKIGELEGTNRQLLQTIDDLNDVTELYNLGQTYSDYPTVAAKVISKTPSNWYASFTINKGTDDGLKKDMNVIADGGLVGIISEAGHNYSVVRTIIDDSSNVTGTFKNTKETTDCNVSGDLTLIEQGLVRVNGISGDTNVKDDDMIITSYNSPKFLPGIIIGYVSDITMDSNNLTKSGKLTPVVDFSNLDAVLVITQLSEQLY